MDRETIVILVAEIRYDSRDKMGKIKEGLLVKRFCGIIYADEDTVFSVKENLITEFGNIDIEAGPFIFDFTDYYAKEMGENLKRRFFSFEQPVSPDNCYKWKYFSNEIENRYISSSGGRKVNIDPGYLNLSRITLLSTKDYYHRVYLQNGIKADLTLYYQGNDFKVFPWTYPDYRSENNIDFFRKVRLKFSQQLK